MKAQFEPTTVIPHGVNTEMRDLLGTGGSFTIASLFNIQALLEEIQVLLPTTVGIDRDDRLFIN